MECDLMENSIKIKNVDEDGNEIENVDWSKWKRERVEEVFDGNNNLVMILSIANLSPKKSYTNDF